MKIRTLIKSALPPFLLSALRPLWTTPPPESIRCTGDFDSWEEAERASIGYSAPIILQKTRAALLKVKNGEAAFERDSVVFAELECPFPLLAGLLRAAVGSEGRLSVLDFGGALGSTYYQCRDFLSGVRELRWSIVEQPAHVVCGRQEFANEQLHFYETIEDCLSNERPNLLLLSGVVQCLQKPYDFLADVVRYKFPYIIVDRTGFMRSGRDCLTVQHVPAWIYKASYPTWFLSEARFHACFNGQYDLVCEFPGAENFQPETGEAFFKGFLFEIKTGGAPVKT